MHSKMSTSGRSRSRRSDAGRNAFRQGLHGSPSHVSCDDTLLRPEGATECSHGWSEVRRKASDAAQPVESDEKCHLALKGRRKCGLLQGLVRRHGLEFLRSFRAVLVEQMTTGSVELRSTPPVATTLRPFGAPLLLIREHAHTPDNSTTNGLPQTTPTHRRASRQCCRSLFTLLIFLFAFSPAHAQILDLGAPDPPAVAETGIDEQRARVVEAEIQRLTDQHEPGPRLDAAIAIRRYGLRLLASDLDAHPERFIPGVLLTEQAATLDRLIFDESALLEPAAKLLARTLADAPIPAEAIALDRLLRDAFADLADSAEITDPIGWPAKPGATPPDLERLASLLENAPEACAARADDLARVLSLAADHPAYRPSAMRSASALLAIAPILSPPSWMEERVEALQLQACEAIDGLLDPELQQASLAALEDLAQWARAIEAAGRLEDSTETRLALRAIAEAAETGLSRGDLGALARAMDLASARADLPSPRTLVRQLRPSWERLEREARRTERELIAVIPDLVADPEAMVGGRFVTPMAAHREAIADLRILVDMSARIADPTRSGPEPVLAPRFGPLATEAVRQGNLLRTGDDDSAARVALRELAEAARVAIELRGEAELRRQTSAARNGPPESWRVPDLLELIERERVSMLSARRADDLSARAARLFVLDDLTEQMVLVLQAREPGALEAWPGWSLPSAPARSLAINGADDSLGRIASDLLEGRYDRARDALTLYRQRFAFARLLGRMERAASGLGLSAQPSDALIARLTAGAPDPVRAWMAAERRTLAELCRYASILPNLADTRLETEIRRHLNELALGVLERLGER